MSDKYFVDTNILMYAHDTSAGAKHERAKALVEELWRDRTGVVSTQVLQELCVNLRRKAGRPLDRKATREIVADYLDVAGDRERRRSDSGALGSGRAAPGLILGRPGDSRRTSGRSRSPVLRGYVAWAGYGSVRVINPLRPR